MALQKQSLQINFGQGIDTFIDANQLPMGKFTSLVNATFVKNGDYLTLQKRYGFLRLTSLLNQSQAMAMYNGNLLALGQSIQAYNATSTNWLDTGIFHPLSLSTQSVVRNLYNQSQADSCISPSGLLAATYMEARSSGNVFLYTVMDAETGQAIIPPTQFTPNTGTQANPARVFYLNNRFVYLFDGTSSSSASPFYMTINATSAQVIGTATSVSSATFTWSTNQQLDGVVCSNTLYLGWIDNKVGGAAWAGTITSAFAVGQVLSGPVGVNGTRSVSVSYDTLYNQMYLSAGLRTATNQVIVYQVNPSLTTFTAVNQYVSSTGGVINNLTSVAANGINYLYLDCQNTYPAQAGSGQTDIINNIIVGTAAFSTQQTLLRGMGLGSKAFLFNNQPYFWTAYQSTYQNCYFLIGSASTIAARLAYGNGGGYMTNTPPSVTIVGSQASFAYQVKDFITPVNSVTVANLASTTQTAGIYTQTGINLCKVDFSSRGVQSKESGKNLLLNGGILWSYDGSKPVENNFLIYPEPVTVTSSGSSTVGSLTPQQYYYQATYEWTDNQGNIVRSSPSIPVSTTVSSGTTRNLLAVPLLRATYRTPTNPVRIAIYRWSTSQQVYFKLNNGYLQDQTLIDSQPDAMVVADGLSDSAILGNEILYTNGDVLENEAPTSFNSITLFDSRLWGIDAEDPNQLWFSKQVIQNTPVEMSAFLTFYVEPNAGAQGPTGPMRAIAPMDDKLIIFKRNAMYYIAGAGPDNTGANNQYAPPTFITGTVGCVNPRSIVSTPVGLMFQSEEGIWLLKREVQTEYIGKDVEAYNGLEVRSAICAPGTNQVRFSLSDGTTLVYDYFVNQWGTFSGIDVVDSCLYENAHTYVDSQSLVFQETPDYYQDGDTPVTMSFKTGWLNFAGVQGYGRAYNIFMLAKYKSPHSYQMGISYNYDPTVYQTITVAPENTSSASASVEQWQLNLEKQQCQSIQLTFNEVSSSRADWGAGLVLSNMNVVVGLKKSFPVLPAANKQG